MANVGWRPPAIRDHGPYVLDAPSTSAISARELVEPGGHRLAKSYRSLKHKNSKHYVLIESQEAHQGSSALAVILEGVP